ncbi:hypothetical protein AHAS_Ahas18G0223400 [Arachis hypogaea]
MDFGSSKRVSTIVLVGVKMARKGRYTKKPKLGPGCQQPLTAPPLGSGSHQADSQVLPAGGDAKFHIDEDSEGSIKKYILKSMGRSWKDTRLRLYNAFYEPTFTFEQNIEHRPPEID